MTEAPVTRDPTRPAPPTKSDLRRAVASIWLGTTLEYVDFALYGLAAGLVFGPVFFPETTPTVALLAGFGTYAVGFLARPAGALYFGRLGDRRGRKLPLLLTIALMGLSTSAIGLLPSYATAGLLGPALLVLLRLVQGFAAGAEMSGGVIMLAEFAPPRRRGLVSSVIAIGSNGGLIIASAVWLAVSSMPRDDLLEWGWRIPFLASVVVAAAALVLRRQMPESPVMAARPDPAASEGRRSWRPGRAFLALLGLRIAENGPSYLASTFVVGYVATTLAVARTVPTAAVLTGSVLGVLAVPLVGHLTDVLGRRPVYRALCAFLVVYAFPAYWLLQSRDATTTFVVVAVGVVVATVAMFAAQAAYGVELFGSRNRYRSMALAKEVGSVVSGGMAPLLATGLLAATGHWWAVATYFALMALVGLVTTFMTPETQGRDLTTAEDAL